VPLGLGAGCVDAALNNYVALNYKARHMNWLHCFWGVGASAGSLIMSAYLLREHPWNSGYRAIGIIQLILAVLLCISLPFWGKAAATAKTRDDTSAPDGVTERPPRFADLLRIPGVKHMLTAFFCYCAIEQVAGLWGTSYLVIVRHIAPESAARWIALYYGGITAGRFISGFLTLKLTSRQMIRAGQLIIACGIGALYLPSGTIILPCAFFLIGLGCAPIYPGLLHQTPERFGSTHSQSIMGIQMAFAYISVTVIPPLFGRLAAYTGFELFPIFLAAFLLVKIIMTEAKK
jgi:fucose permease